MNTLDAPISYRSCRSCRLRADDRSCTRDSSGARRCVRDGSSVTDPVCVSHRCHSRGISEAATYPGGRGYGFELFTTASTKLSSRHRMETYIAISASSCCAVRGLCTGVDEAEMRAAGVGVAGIEAPYHIVYSDGTRRSSTRVTGGRLA